MKLHLPTSLRGALIACMGVACLTNSVYADTYAAKYLGGANSAATHIVTYVSGSDGTTTKELAALASTDTVEIGSMSGWFGVGNGKDAVAYSAALSLTGVLNINNGNSGTDATSYKTMTYQNAISGTTASQFNYTGDPSYQNFVFSGEMKDFLGSISIGSSGKGGATSKLTFSNAPVDGTTNSCTLNASSVYVKNILAFESAYTINSTLTAGTLDLNASITASKNITVTSAFDLASEMTATITSGTLDLTGATLTNNGTIDLSSGDAQLRLAEDNDYSGTYSVGSLTLGDRSLDDILLGLNSRQTASYSDGIITIGGDALNLIWNGAAGTAWTNGTGSDGTWQTEDGAASDFLAMDSAVFGASASNKQVTISESVKAGTITIEDDYEFNVTSASTITGTFSMDEGTTLTKTGNAALTIGGSNSDFANLVVSSGTLNISNSSVDKLTTQANTTTNLNGGLTITEIEASGTLNANSSLNNVSLIELKEDARLNLGVGVDLTANKITMADGSRIALKNGQWWSGHTLDALIEVSGEAEISGATNGNSSTIQGSINGNGTLKLVTTDTGTNAWYLQSTISDGTGEGDQLALAISSKVTISGTNSYSGGTTITGQEVTVAADSALGTGAVSVNGGSLKVSGTHSLSNTIKAGSAAAIGAAGASYSGVTITSSSLTGGTATGTDISVTGDYALSGVTLTDSAVSVADGATLSLADALAAGTSSLDVAAGGTLDLTGITTLDFASVNLASASTLIVGDYLTNGAISFTGNINLAENVIIDLSAWCKNTAESPGDNLTVFQAWQPLFTYTGSDTSVLNSMAAMDGHYVTIKVSDYETQYGTLRYDSATNSILLVPEPTTATLSLLALAGLAARRRRK